VLDLLSDATTAQAQSVRRFYQPELDGLRFYAFLGVFVCHTLPFDDLFYQRLHLPLPWIWGAAARAGGAGVDLFFVLSAYLITSLLLRERQKTGDLSLRSFYIRRTLRIWPLYFLVVALGLVFAHTGGEHETRWFYYQRLPWYYVLGYALFISNWIYAIFGVAQSLCAPLWTVSIEEQFYLIWPALMKRLRHRGMIIAAALTFVLSIASQVGLVLIHANPNYIDFGSASRVSSLALGILLALYADRLPRRLSSGSRVLLVVAGVTAWVGSSAWITDNPGPISMRMVLVRLIVSIASAAILYGCIHSNTRLLTGNYVVRLGKISYGLYMFHFMGMLLALTLLHPVSRWQLIASRVLGFVLTLVLALASYRWVESPFLRLKDRFATVLSRPV
jgi:peptidoglycan/LPS O-acetylase OafA/YrhL